MSHVMDLEVRGKTDSCLFTCIGVMYVHSIVVMIIPDCCDGNFPGLNDNDSKSFELLMFILERDRGSIN